MPGYAPFVDCDGRRALRSAKARGHKPRSRGLEIPVAHFGNRCRGSIFRLLPLRVTSLRCRAMNFLRPPPCLINRVWPVGTDLHSPGCAPHSDLRNEDLLAGGINAQPETGGATAPDEIFEVCGPCSIDSTLCQAGHVTVPKIDWKHIGSNRKQSREKWSNTENVKMDENGWFLDFLAPWRNCGYAPETLIPYVDIVGVAGSIPAAPTTDARHPFVSPRRCGSPATA